MKYSAQITVSEDIKALFESETKDFPNKRASYEIIRSEDKNIFKITATDATALRAVLNSITKNLIVYEKVKNGQGN